MGLMVRKFMSIFGLVSLMINYYNWGLSVFFLMNGKYLYK